jgi:hypothetical protein
MFILLPGSECWILGPECIFFSTMLICLEILFDTCHIKTIL